MEGHHLPQHRRRYFRCAFEPVVPYRLSAFQLTWVGDYPRVRQRLHTCGGNDALLAHVHRRFTVYVTHPGYTTHAPWPLGF